MKASIKLLNEIKKLIEDPYNYLENDTIENKIPLVIKIIRYAKFMYFNSEEIMSDSTYDLLTDYLDKYGTPEQKEVLYEIGETVVIHKHKLPYVMGSMDKIKITDINKLKSWMNKYSGPYLLSDKLDGISAMLVYKNNEPINLYTRGDGTVGMNISHLIDYLSGIPKKIQIKNIIIRGELIMNKKLFDKKYADKMANARNMVAGQINRKKFNSKIMKDIDFVAYEIIEPWTNIKSQYQQLEKLNFNIPNYNIIKHENLSMTNLSKELKRHKNNSSYELDGIIINDTNNHKRYTADNPEYSFAFKELLEDLIVTVKVLDVEWNVSKDGYIKPKLLLEPTKLSGVIIKNVTAFNAKFIKDNNLGPGSIIKLTRSGDVIPHIVSVIKSTKAKFPDKSILDWEWNKSAVDIIVKSNKVLQQRIKELTFFLKNLNVKYIDEKLVEKLYSLGYKNIKNYFKFNKNDLINISGFKETMINKIDNEIKTAIQNMTLLDLMVASNIFGHGMGRKKLNKIITQYPDIILKKYMLTKKQLYDKIIGIKGFDDITTSQFVKNLTKFCNFFLDLPKTNRNRLLIETIIINKFSNIKKSNNKFKDLKFVFSDFRNKEWEEYIISNGGSVTGTVSKYTNYIVTSTEQKKNPSNSKVLKAKELNIKILDKNDFIKLFFN